MRASLGHHIAVGFVTHSSRGRSAENPHGQPPGIDSWLLRLCLMESSGHRLMYHRARSQCSAILKQSQESIPCSEEGGTSSLLSVSKKHSSAVKGRPRFATTCFFQRNLSFGARRGRHHHQQPERRISIASSRRPEGGTRRTLIQGNPKSSLLNPRTPCLCSSTTLSRNLPSCATSSTARIQLYASSIQSTISSFWASPRSHPVVRLG